MIFSSVLSCCIPSLHAQPGNSLIKFYDTQIPAAVKNRENGRIVKKETVEGQAPDLAFVHLYFLFGGIRDSRKYDTFRGKKVVLFMNLLEKGLIQEIIQWK